MEPRIGALRLNDMGDSGKLAAELAAHEGIITAERALACGLSRGQIMRRVEAGEWKKVARGVYRSATHEYSESAMVRTVVAAVNGVADRTTAAWWHGLLETLPETLTVAVPSSAPGRWTGGKVDTIRRSYHEADVKTVRGLPVTGLPMTVLTAAVHHPDGATLMDRALQQHPVNVADLEASLERNAGLRGFTAARKLVAVAAGDTESAAERLFLDLLESEEIGGWVLQHPFGAWRIDVAWPAEKVAVEIDGWAFHRTTEQLSRDNRKRNALVKAHWFPLSFSWHQLSGDPVGCIADVTEALADRRLELM